MLQPTILASNVTQFANSVAYGGAAGGHTFIVPVGVYVIRIIMWGPGGTDDSIYAGTGAAGGFVQCDYAVTPGDSYTIIVGDSAGVGSGGAGRGNGGNGGGCCYVYKGKFIAIVGGGGGGSDAVLSPRNGKCGGSNIGEAIDALTTGGDTTVPSGGLSQYGSPGTAGTSGTTQGGGGAASVTGNGGGGGGGYCGGGGGGDSGGGVCVAGAGGSSYVDPSATNVTNTRSTSSATPPMTSHVDYVSPAGTGGAGTRVGRVVIRY